MPIDFNCKGCGKHYRVRDELAGRMAECKNCGTKMTVPASSQPASPPKKPADDVAAKRSHDIGFQDEDDSPPPQSARTPARRAGRDPEPEPEPQYGSESSYESESSDQMGDQTDEMGVGPEPEDDRYGGGPSMRDFDVKDDAPEAAETRRQRQQPLLPDVVGEMALPLVAILVCLGGAGFAAFKWATSSTNPLIAFVLIAIGLALFFLVIVPLTLKGLESAATNIGFELANALKLQTVGLVAIPTGAIVLGYLNEGVSGAINWGILGLLVMVVAIVLIYRAGVVKSLLAGLWTAVTYALTAGLSVGIAALIAFGMTKAGVRMPWEDKPAPVVAKVDPDAEKKAEEQKREEERLAAAANVPTVVEAPTIDPTPPPKPAVTWTPINDPSPLNVRWPNDLKNQLIDAKPPVTMAVSSPGSPFVAFVDSVALHVYDVRTGKRTGFIKDKIPVIGSLLSPDGTMLIVNRRAEGNPTVSGGAIEFEVWSLPEARRSRTLSLDSSRQIPRMLGFDKDNRLVTVGESSGKALVQAWDLRSASPVREMTGPQQLAKPQAAALSAGGRFIACVADNRLSVFDLNAGTLVCDREMPHRDAQVRAMSFSPDGSQLAAVVNENNANHLVLFNNETGDVALDAALGGGARTDLSADQMFWVPRGGALLIDNDWVDTATGRIIAILPPQTAGQSVGKPKLMFSDSQALVEFLPAGNAQRVIYKGVTLNKREIDAALATRRAKSSGDASASPGEVAEAPTTAPVGEPKDLIRAAVDHLAAGRNRDAIAHAQAALDKLPKSPKVASDEQAIALHCLGAAYMRAGDLQKARDPIDKAASYAKTSRSLTLNRAKLDIASQNFVVRAIRDLDKQLATNLDEETLNLMGLAINKTTPSQATPAQLKVLTDKYDAYNKKLEATKPGMRHWGSQWISESEFATAASPPELVDEKSKGDERVKLAAAELERTRKGFQDAKKQSFYDANKKDIPRDAARKNQPMYLSKAEDEFAAAQKEVDAAKLDLDAIAARFPKPPFEENLEPIVPELELVAKAP